MTTRLRTRLLVADDEAQLARLAAETVARKIVRTVKARAICSVALSGWPSLRPVYDELGNSDLAGTLAWDQLEFYFADERAMPIDDPESSYRLARETLFRSHPEGIGRCYRMPADAADLEEAAARYGRRLPDPVDVVVLAMGEDGRTAGLLPGSPALEERDRRVVAVAGPREGLTIAPSVIELAGSVVVVAAGVEKGPLVARAISGLLDPKACPAQLARRATWVVDRAAASQVI